MSGNRKSRIQPPDDEEKRRVRGLKISFELKSSVPAERLSLLALRDLTVTRLFSFDDVVKFAFMKGIEALSLAVRNGDFDEGGLPGDEIPVTPIPPSPLITAPPAPAAAAIPRRPRTKPAASPPPPDYTPPERPDFGNLV